MIFLNQKIKCRCSYNRTLCESVTNNTTNMYRAIDENRDQVIFYLTLQRDSNYLRFPLGGMLKSETREIAKKLELNVAEKPDSQDICFVPNGDYVSVIQKLDQCL